MKFPITNATINLTKSCNLKCSYCFAGGKSNKIISLDMAKKSVDFLIKNAQEADLKDLVNNRRIIDISFWGGEPLLEWDLLKKIVLYTEKVKPSNIELNFGGTINGTLLTPDKFDFLDEHKILFMISLDGTKETHDKYRVQCNGKGSQEIIVNNLKEVLKKWPFYKVRMSPYPERIDHFYEDIKYLVDLGVTNFYFSPVYEHKWTDKHWETWKNECFKVVDLISEYQQKGIEIKIEHFMSYSRGSDDSVYPCGAGRFYVGIDTDGSIWPCHRFIKFSDTRPWQEKEWCIGHVEYGITRPEVRNKFIDFKVKGCAGKDCYLNSPCHGSCYATNFDLEGEIEIPHKQTCKYVEMQIAVSNYYKEKVEIPNNKNCRSCVCYNMCYAEGTKDEIINVDLNTDMHCHCYNAAYSGTQPATELSEERKRGLSQKKVTPMEVMNKLLKIELQNTEILKLLKEMSKQ